MVSKLRAFWGGRPKSSYILGEFQKTLVDQIKELMPDAEIQTRQLASGKFRLGVTMPGVRKVQQGNAYTDQLVLDIGAGPMTKFGQYAVEQYYETGQPKIWGPTIEGETPEAIQFYHPAQAFARRIQKTFKVAEKFPGTAQSLWERLPEMTAFTPPGMLIERNPAMALGWTSREAEADFASRVRMTIPEGSYSKPFISAVAERAMHARSLGLQAQLSDELRPWLQMVGMAPMSERETGIVWRGAGVESGSQSVTMLGKQHKWFKHQNIANIQYGGVRERAGLYEMLLSEAGEALGLQEIEPQFITGSGYTGRAGLRWSNLQGPAGERLSGFVVPNVAQVPGFPYSGSTMLYRDVFNAPGQPALWSAGIQSPRFAQLSFTEDVRTLRNAQFEFGRMSVERAENGEITGYTRTGGLEGFYVEPGEEAIIGMASFKRGEQQIYEPISVTAGSGRFWLDPKSIELRLPYEYRASTGEGLAGFETYVEPIRGKGQPQAAAAGGVLSTQPFVDELSRQLGDIPVVAGTAGRVGVYFSGVSEVGIGAKGGPGAFKSALMMRTTRMDESGQVSVNVGDAPQVLSGITAAIKNPIEFWKWQFGFKDPTTQGELAGIFGGSLGRRMQSYVAEQNKPSTLGISRLPAALSPRAMAEIYAEERGLGNISLEETEYRMWQEMLTNVEQYSQKYPQEALDKFGYAANVQAQSLDLGEISSSQRAVLRQSAAEALRGGPLPTSLSEYRQWWKESQAQYGKSPYQMREDVLQFSRTIPRGSVQFGTSGQYGAPWRGSLRTPFNIADMVFGPAPEFMSRAWAGLGFDEIAAVMAEQPLLARQVGADPAMTVQQQKATGQVQVPPHQQAWREIVESVRANREGLSGFTPASYTTVTKDMMMQIQSEMALAKGDFPLGRIEEIVGGQGPLFNPYTNSYIPRPSSIENVTKYRYAGEDLRSAVTGLTYLYRNALPDFFVPRNIEGSSMQKFRGRLQGIVEAQGVAKLAQQRFIAGTIGGRYGAETSIELFEGILQPDYLRRGLMAKGRAAGLAGDELERWVNIAQEQSQQFFGLREPVAGRGGGLLLETMTPARMLRERGLVTPTGSQMFGRSPRLGSPVGTGFMGSLSAIMAAIQGDWDYDFAFALLTGTVDKEKGLAFPEGVTPTRGWFQQVRSYYEKGERLMDEKRVAFDPIVNEFKDIFQGANKLVGTAKDYLTTIPYSEMIEESGLLVQSVMGMGVSYNARRMMEASASALAYSPGAIGAGHTRGAETYQPYLDKMIMEIQKQGGFTNIETMLNTAMFTQRGNEAAMIAKVGGPESRWSVLWESSRSMTSDITQDIAPIVARAAQKDKISPLLAAYYFGTSGIPLGALEKKFAEAEDWGSVVSEMAMAGTGAPGAAESLESYFGMRTPPGGGSIYDWGQSPLGAATILTGAVRTKGGFGGRNPKEITLMSGEPVTIESVIEGMKFPLGRTRRGAFSRRAAETIVNREKGWLVGDERNAEIAAIMGQQIIAPEALVDVTQIANQPFAQRAMAMYGTMTRARGGSAIPTYAQSQEMYYQMASLMRENRPVPEALAYNLALYPPGRTQMPMPNLWGRAWGYGPESSRVYGTSNPMQIRPGDMHGRTSVEEGPLLLTAGGGDAGNIIPPTGGAAVAGATPDPRRGNRNEFIPVELQLGRRTVEGRIGMYTSEGQYLGGLLGGLGGEAVGVEQFAAGLAGAFADPNVVARMEVMYRHQGQGMSPQEARRLMSAARLSGLSLQGRGLADWGSQMIHQLRTTTGVNIGQDLSGLPEAVSRVLADPTLTRQMFGGQWGTIKMMGQYWGELMRGTKAFEREREFATEEEVQFYREMGTGTGELGGLKRATFMGGLISESLKATGFGTRTSMRGGTLETLDEFISRMQTATKELDKLSKATEGASTENERWTSERKQQLYELQQFTMPQLRGAYETRRMQLDAGMVTEEERAAITSDMQRLAPAIRRGETVMNRLQQEIEQGPPSTGRQISGAVRRLIGGWGLFYLGHLAGFPQRAWEYGMGEGMQYAQAQEAYGGGIMGGGGGFTPYAQAQNIMAQSRVLSGGLPGAYMQQQYAALPGGIRDIGGAVMAGAAGYAGALYIGQAFENMGVMGPIGQAITRYAPQVGLLGLGLGIMSAQSAYASFPDQALSRGMIDAYRQERGGFRGFLSGISRSFTSGYDDYYFQQYGAYNQALDEMLRGGPAQLPTAVHTPSASGRGVTTTWTGRPRPMTRDDLFVMATALQGRDEFQGLDPTMLSQTFLRWAASGQPIQGANLRATVQAQMTGIPIPELAQQYQQAYRLSAAPSAGLEFALTQALPDIYTAGRFQTGTQMVGAMPVAQLALYSPPDETARINQLLQMREYQQSGMDVFLQQQGQILQQSWMWGLPTYDTQIPVEATAQERRDLSARYSRLASGQSMMTQYLTRGMQTPFMQSMIGRMGGRIWGREGRGGYTTVPGDFTPQQLAQMARTNQFQEALVQSGAPVSMFTGGRIDQMMATAGGTALAMGGLEIFTRMQQAGLDTSGMGIGIFTDFSQQALANIASNQGVQLRGMGIAPTQANAIVAQMQTGYGAASFISGALSGNPIQLTQAAAQMYNTPGGGRAFSDLYATMDVGTGGPLGGGGYGPGNLTGLPLFTTSMWQGSIPPQTVATRIWGMGWTQSAAARAGVYGWNIQQGRQATAQEMRTGGAGIAGGMWGMQAYMNNLQYSAQMAQIGSQMAQLNLSYAFQTGIGLEGYSTTDPRTGKPFNIQGSGGFWGIEDRQRALQHEQALWGFEYQQRSFEMQGRQFMENWMLNRQQSQMQRGWTQADWTYQDQVRGMQWQWRQEDFAENVRFMTGRERRLATRQMERETTMFGMEGERIDTQRNRQREMWALEDERFDLQKKQFEEQRALLDENMKKQREFYDEGKELQDQATELQRAYFIENHKLQMAALGAQAGYAKAMKDAQDKMILLQQEQDRVQGKFRVASSLEEQFINNIVAGLNHLIKYGHDLWEKIKSGAQIPGYSNPNSLPGEPGTAASCFDGNAVVTMADGTHKPIKSILVGDKVQSAYGGVNTVVGIETPKLGKRKMYGFNNTYTFVSEEHPLLTDRGWAAFDPDSWAVEESFKGKLETIVLGTVMKTAYGDEKVYDIWFAYDDEDKTIYNLLLDGDHTYIVEGYFVHNKDVKPDESAIGGSIFNRGTIVGESGVEYIKPKVPMSIIPNNELRAMAKGGQTLHDPWDNYVVTTSPPGGVSGQPMTVVINIGNQHLGDFVIRAVKQDLSL